MSLTFPIPRLHECHLEIAIPHLPAVFDGFRILHITDLHIKDIGPREKAVLQTVWEHAPDLIALTGDFVDRKQDRDVCLEFASRLSAPSGVWGVGGNWDHYTQRPYHDYVNALRRAGVEVLNNTRARLERHGSHLEIAGVDDPHTGHDDVRAALDSMPEHRACILLAHSPDIIGQILERPVDLALVGHTHGGQVCLPGRRPLWVPSRHGRKYAAGLFTEERVRMFVNRGVGMSTLPVRVFCPPEIALFTLRAVKERKEQVA